MELGTQDTDHLRQTGMFANNSTTINVPLANSGGQLLTNYVLGAAPPTAMAAARPGSRASTCRTGSTCRRSGS